MFDRTQNTKRSPWQQWRPRDGAEVWHPIHGPGTVVRDLVYWAEHPVRGTTDPPSLLTDVGMELEPGLSTLDANRRRTK